MFCNIHFWVQIPSSQISPPTCLSTARESVAQGLVAQLWKGKYGLTKRSLPSSQKTEIKCTALTSNCSMQSRQCGRNYRQCWCQLSNKKLTDLVKLPFPLASICVTNTLQPKRPTRPPLPKPQNHYKNKSPYGCLLSNSEKDKNIWKKKIIRKKSEWEGERKRSFISSPTTLGSAALQLATSN